MGANDVPLFDAWTPLSFKRVLGSKETPGTTLGLPSWVGDHKRRLMAYQMLQAYIDNAGRYYLSDPNEASRDQHREYGDAALIRDQVLAALLGEDQTIVTERADEFDPNWEKAKSDGQDVGQVDPNAVAAETEPPDPEVMLAWQFQEWIRGWGDDERLPLKSIETERNAVGLGDGVYTLGWSNDKTRVRLRCWDPGFYFPVLDDGNEDDFPSKVHIAWEVPQPEGTTLIQIRRLTWELIDVPAYTVPYQDTKATRECVMSDGTWTVDLGAPDRIDALTTASVKWAEYTDPRTGAVVDWDQIPQGFDFMPVIHEPNTIALIEHYGRSSLSAVMQILDDLANGDTDLQAASGTTGKPVITLSGATTGVDSKGEPNRMSYQAGEVIETGDGKMDMLDTSKSLDALVKYAEFLLDRLSVNSRLPGSVLGRVDQSEIKSGIHLRLTFGPLSALIGQMRLVRDEKYRLLFKMVWRISKVANATGVPDTYQPTAYVLGSFLPSDEANGIEQVTKLLAAQAISLETAVQMLINIGLPIDDAAAEVKRIQERMFEEAVTLLEALGSEAEVAEFLNRDVPPAQPVLGVEPGAGGTAPVIQPPPGVPVAPAPLPGEVAPPVAP